MADWKIGQVVRSKAGRDKGRLLVVADITETTVMVCDGKERPLERPKVKNPRHIESERPLITLPLTTNRALRRALRQLSEG